MKTFYIALAMLLVTHTGFSQKSCEARELELTKSLGAFSAVSLLNIHYFSESISTAHKSNGYTDAAANTKFNLLKVLLEQLTIHCESLIKEKALKDQADIEFVKDVIKALDGYTQSTDAYLDYIKSKKSTALNDYTQQNERNWKSVSVLLDME